MLFRSFCRFFLCGLLFALVVPTAALADEGLAARVGKVPVTRFEVERQFRKILPLAGSFHGGVSAEKVAELRKQALDELVERAYKVQYAMDSKIEADVGVIDERLEKVRAGFASQKEYEQGFGAEGEEGYRASLYREQLAKAAEAQVVDARIAVTEEEVRAYYEENRARFKMPRSWKASHILIKVDPSSRAEERAALKEKADDLAVRAKTGEDFYNLAYYNSDDRSRYVGGDLGLIHEGQTISEFEGALKTMKAGDISAPVRSLHGYHIIKVDEANDPRQISFDGARERIHKILSGKLRKDLYGNWMGGLKKKYEVTYFQQ